MEKGVPFKKFFFGISSLMLVLAAFGLGLAVIISNSRPLGWLYAGILVAGFLSIVYSFCGKCPCREAGCGHMLPGFLARLLPRRRPGLYTRADLAGVIIPLLLMIGMPQFWLRHSRGLLVAFWLLLVIALVEIRTFVCPACGNRECPAAVKR